MTETDRIDSIEYDIESLAHLIAQNAIQINKLSSEMKDFKDEMKDFKDESKISRDEMNVKWGNLANSLGRVVEDLIIPNIDLLIKKYFEEEMQDYYGSLYKRDPITNEGREFDGIITTENRIFLFEVKTKVTKDHAQEMRKFVGLFFLISSPMVGSRFTQ